MDDIHDFWVEPGQLTVMDLFLSKNLSLSLGVIMHYIGTDPKLIEKIQEGNHRGLFELALHGWDHVDYTTLSEQEQHDSLQMANEKMREIFGNRSNIFIPPFNTFDDSTLSAMHQLHLGIISGQDGKDQYRYFISNGRGTQYGGDQYQIYHMPQMTSFEDFNNGYLIRVPVPQILNDVDYSIKLYGYAVITMHPQSFVKQKQDGDFTQILDKQQIKDLTSLIDSIKSRNLKITTFSKVIQAG